MRFLIHIVIAYLLKRFTKFQVVAWENNQIAVISSPELTRAQLDEMTSQARLDPDFIERASRTVQQRLDS